MSNTFFKAPIFVFLISVVFLTMGWLAPSQASTTVVIAGLPETVEDFVALQKEKNTPEGAASCFIAAMLSYAKDPDLARAFFTLSLTDTNLVSGTQGYGGKQPDAAYKDHIDLRLRRDPGMARSYVHGTSRNDNYVLPGLPYNLIFSRNARSVESEDLIRVYVHSTGADTPRPMLTKKGADGLWRVDGASSVFVGVAAPQKN